jgi:hypothetical protein
LVVDRGPQSLFAGNDERGNLGGLPLDDALRGPLVVDEHGSPPRELVKVIDFPGLGFGRIREEQVVMEGSAHSSGLRIIGCLILRLSVLHDEERVGCLDQLLVAEPHSLALDAFHDPAHDIPPGSRVDEDHV